MKAKRTLEQVFLMTGFCEQFLQNAKAHVCYRDNSQASRDAESILWACKKICESERLGDVHYANFLQSELRKGF